MIAADSPCPRCGCKLDSHVLICMGDEVTEKDDAGWTRVRRTPCKSVCPFSYTEARINAEESAAHVAAR